MPDSGRKTCMGTEKHRVRREVINTKEKIINHLRDSNISFGKLDHASVASAADYRHTGSSGFTRA